MSTIIDRKSEIQELEQHYRKYEKPSVKVFELKQQPRLLAGSNGGGKPLDPFIPGGDPLNL